MTKGSVAAALKSAHVVSLVLVLLIAVCSVLIGVLKLSVPWSIAIQVASAVAGAALGNFLRHDFANSTVRNQARPATRHLFDQVLRLRGLVQRAEAYQAAVTESGAAGLPLDWARTGDWFGGLGANLRDEINATAAAIESWGDLVPEVREDELANYEGREHRLPGQKGPEGS